MESQSQVELEKLAALPNRRLHLGCGTYILDGWTNIDGGDGNVWPSPNDPGIVALDVFEALAALPSDSVEFIMSEQFVEHFTRQDGGRLMTECHRVLRPGGVVRSQMPDLDHLVRLYLNEVPWADWQAVQLPHRLRHIAGSPDPYARLWPGESYTRAMMINNGFHMDGHRFIYDYETFEQTLRLAGFTRVERVNFGESRHDALRDTERHDGGPSGASWIPRGMLIVEAQK